jgi:hypothetical protein
MAPPEDTDLSWLDEDVRRGAADMLQVLFSSSRICLVTFDAEGTIVGVNPQTASFGGQPSARYQGVQLLHHPILKRLGWTGELEQVLAGETVEWTDTRWVTLFSGEERFVDILAGPVMAHGRVVGGVIYLVDSTDKHRAVEAETANRRRTRELEVFLARDVAKLVTALHGWSRTQTPSLQETATAMETVAELSDLLDDLLQFVQLGTYKPTLERLPLVEVLRASGLANHVRTPAAAEPLAVLADRRLLRRVLRNLSRFSLRTGASGWQLETRDGRTRLTLKVDCSELLLRELLTASTLTITEADSANESLAAARWMVEMMGGSLTVNVNRSGLCLDLPASDLEASAVEGVVVT